jgi:hypothetical protein
LILDPDDNREEIVAWMRPAPAEKTQNGRAQRGRRPKCRDHGMCLEWTHEPEPERAVVSANPMSNGERGNRQAK